MIATLLANAGGDRPKAVPVTFVIVSDHLVTIRYDEPRAFVAFANSVERQPDLAENGADAFVGLLDAIVDRISEVLEGASSEVESISGAIFSKHRVGPGGHPRAPRPGEHAGWEGPREPGQPVAPALLRRPGLKWRSTRIAGITSQACSTTCSLSPIT